ncbi:cardiolipin synthase [Metabacillus sp. 84]|uniref:cardiolipin synthase n=1 Tax=unclassified Metabacillus TaxID=2675274 RepID=UPI003CEF8158
MLKKLLLTGALTAITLFGIGYHALRDIRSQAEVYSGQHPLAASKVSYGDADLLTDGNQLLHSLFNDIHQAEHYIYIHFFIIRNDGISRKFLNLLEDKAEEGIEVKLSVDAIGGNEITDSLISKLEKSGVQFTKSRPISAEHFFYRLNHRNHRKLAVMDGTVSYIGGFNVGEEYIGKDPSFGYWRDYHVRLTGPGSHSIAEQFLKDWEEDTGIRLSVPVSRAKAEPGSERYQLLYSTGPDLEKKMIELIGKAKISIMIATPYFIPTDALMDALLSSIRRGVKVELLIPDKPDYWYTKPPSYPRTRKLLKEGADVYLYQKGFFHGKVFVIDDTVADIGTANWDKRSLFLNDEANCLFYSQPFISKIKKELQKDISSSRSLTEDMYEELPYWEKALEHTPSWIYELF